MNFSGATPDIKGAARSILEGKKKREERRERIIYLPKFLSFLILVCHDLPEQVCIAYAESSFNLEK